MTISQKQYAGISVIAVWLITILVTAAISWNIASPTEKKCDTSAQPFTAFTNPELDCIDDERYIKLTDVENAVRTYTQSIITEGKSNRVSVFFRDLESKQWFGVNENQFFSPGSLLKVPLAMAYLKSSEIDPGIMDKKIVYNPQDSVDMNTQQHYPPPNNLVVGQSYTISELIERMIVYSDNDFLYALFTNIDQNYYLRVLTDLGLYVETSQGVGADFVTVKSQSNIFRTLYNASYLNREQSEYLLRTLSNVSFKNGLVSGIPIGTKISHKFGESAYKDTVNSPISSVELHDCGIVYKKDPSYILCVMTEGKTHESQEVVIQNISRIVYDNI